MTDPQRISAFSPITEAAATDRLVIVDVPNVPGGTKRIDASNLNINLDITAAEIAAGVTPTNLLFPPGDVRRYGAVGSPTDDIIAFNNAILSNAHVIAPYIGVGYTIGTTLTWTRTKQVIEIFDDITYTGTANTGLFKISNTEGCQVSCFRSVIGNDDNFCVHFERGTSNRFFFNRTLGFIIHFPFIQAVGGQAAGHSLVENYIGYNHMSGDNAADSGALTGAQGVVFRNTTGDASIAMEGTQLEGGFIRQFDTDGIKVENNVNAKYMYVTGVIDNAGASGQDYTVAAGSQQTSAYLILKFIREAQSTFGDGDVLLNGRNAQLFINSESLVAAALDITCKTGSPLTVPSAQLIGVVKGGVDETKRYLNILSGTNEALSQTADVFIGSYYDPGTSTPPVAADAKIAGILAAFRRNDNASAIEGGNVEFQKRAAANTVDLDIQLMNAGTKARKFFVRADGGISVDGTAAVLRSGSATPEGAITAPIGSLFKRTDGGAGTTLYIKESGAGNTGWRLSGPATEVVTTTNVITAAETGTTFYLNTAGGFTSTLPAAAANLRYKFIVSTAPTTAYIITTNSSANVLFGFFLDIVGEQVYFSAQDTLNFVASTSLVGDFLEVESDGTNWYCTAKSGADGGITVAVT